MFLSALAYVLGDKRSVTSLASEVGEEIVGLLKSQGIDSFRHSQASAAELAEASLCETLTRWGRPPAKIDAVFYCSRQIPTGAEREAMSRLFHNTGLLDMPTFGLSMQGCSGLASATRLARAMIRSGEARNIAVVTADVCASPLQRLGTDNAAILSDGAASCVVSVEDGEYELLGLRQTANQRLWPTDPPFEHGLWTMMWARGIRAAVAGAQEDAAHTETPLTAMVCTNLRFEVVSFLTAQCKLPPESAFVGTLAEMSHVFGADPIINILESQDWRRQRSGRQDAPFLVLTLSPFNWTCFVLSERTTAANAQG